MILKFDLCATTNLSAESGVPCLQAGIFRHLLPHCLQASSGTRHFVVRFDLVDRCLCLLKNFLQRIGGGIADSGIFIAKPFAKRRYGRLGI